jgi:hypothetical protein
VVEFISTSPLALDGEKEWHMMDPSPVSSSGLSDQPSETRLASWKEIATYVNRDVRTVQRWEKREGMPVHRHLHDKRGSVYALSSELDAWIQSRRPQLEEQERGVRTPVDATTDHGTGRPQAHRWLALGMVAIVALLAGSYVSTRTRTAHATGPKITSLAVLPLKNLSGDPRPTILRRWPDG